MTRIPDYPAGDSQLWARVDAYLTPLLCRPDDALAAVLAANAQAGLPPHDVSAPQGKMLALFVTLTKARRVLEIGTLGAYSTIWMAHALTEGGSIDTIEMQDHHASLARENLAMTGVQDRVTLHHGPALEVLPRLQGPYDLIFIDADKPNNPAYLRWSIRLARAGTLIIADNVVRGGAVADPLSTEPNVMGVRACLDLIARTPGIEATALQTVGEKGWDGFAMAVVTDPIAAQASLDLG